MGLKPLSLDKVLDSIRTTETTSSEIEDFVGVKIPLVLTRDIGGLMISEDVLVYDTKASCIQTPYRRY